MKNKALFKSIFREINQSKARFFSILGIILLGVAFYSGIKATGPNMLKTAENYYQEQHLMDQMIVSPLGLTSGDLTEINNNSTVSQAEGIYSEDLILNDVNRVIKVQSQNFNKAGLNQPYLVSGRLPKKDTEIVLDNRAQLLGDYKLKDTFHIPNKNQEYFQHKSYKIVGFVNSPPYIENVSRGKTSIGKGSLDYFALISAKEFKTDIYKEIAVTYKNSVGLSSYSNQYEKMSKKQRKDLQSHLKNREDLRYKEVSDTLSKAETDINQQDILLKEGDNQLVKLQEQLTQAKAIPGFDTTELSENVRQMSQELSDRHEQLNKAKEELTVNKKNIDSQKDQSYLYFGREDYPGYSEYKENAKRLAAIATVFPVFFFLIAGLVCLTTMTRMVDEKRSEIGGLKALGYSNFEISLKYLVYAIAASLVGTILGLLIGFNLFPKIIIDAYGSLYNLPSATTTYYGSYAIQSIMAAVVCTVLAALLVLRIDLLSTPAALLRPKAPKAGKRILLERLPFIWNRMKFNQKVTARNLFRYKQRMFMTVFGIAGCMALMITGFGIRDSISDVVSLQFDKLWHYQGVVTFTPETTSADNTSYTETLKKFNNKVDRLSLAQKSLEVTQKTKGKIAVTVNVPKDKTDLSKFILLNNRQTGLESQLTDEGVIINEKLAKLSNVSVGDTLSLSENGVNYPVKISSIVENYAMHFVYMTPGYYQRVFDEKPGYQSELLLFEKDLTEKEENKISEELLNENKVVNVTFSSEMAGTMSDTINSLTVVVWVLIISAGLLAFIVLYNLTNINISERIRELSTIKVLGFYNREVTMYVYRENNILTLLGILVGAVLGKILHRFVLQTSEVDMLMFSPTIHFVSYIYAALLTGVFTVIVMVVMHKKLTKVDMIEALKSNE